MRFICSGWGRARSATGWFYSASLGHRIHRTAFAKGEAEGYRERCPSISARRRRETKLDRYEVVTGNMVPVTGGANRKWGFTGKVETRSYERLVDALIDFVETGDGLKERFLTGFAACLAADRKSVENRGFGVAVRKVQCHRGEDGTVRVSSVETMHERRYTVDDWRYDTAHCEQTENGQKG